MIKKYFFIAALLLFYTIGFSQKYKRVINMPEDSTIQIYLEHSAKDSTIVDSCMSSIYFIRFSLNSQGELKDYSCSQMMPEPFKKFFKQKLASLQNKWDENFLKYVTSQKVMLLQPCVFNITNNCTGEDNYYVKKMDTVNDSSYQYKNYLNHAMIYGLAAEMVSLKSSFIDAFNFDNENDSAKLFKYLFLTPSSIIREPTIKRDKDY